MSWRLQVQIPLREVQLLFFVSVLSAPSILLWFSDVECNHSITDYGYIPRNDSLCAVQTLLSMHVYNWFSTKLQCCNNGYIL